jgi:hypothetical protein
MGFDAPAAAKKGATFVAKQRADSYLLNMTYKYIEMPGGDRGSVIDGSMPEVFAFFNEHIKPSS